MASMNHPLTRQWDTTGTKVLCVVGRLPTAESPKKGGEKKNMESLSIPRHRQKKTQLIPRRPFILHFVAGLHLNEVQQYLGENFKKKTPQHS